MMEQKEEAVLVQTLEWGSTVMRKNSTPTCVTD
jgi:hypothetical protein